MWFQTHSSSPVALAKVCLTFEHRLERSIQAALGMQHDPIAAPCKWRGGRGIRNLFKMVYDIKILINTLNPTPRSSTSIDEQAAGEPGNPQ